MFEDAQASALVSRIVTQYRYPRMAVVRQRFDTSKVDDVAEEVRAQFAREAVRRRLERIRPGDTVALTAGSRQIRNFPAILRAVIARLEERGARPFIIPAMGSHGGATAEGQREVLASLGVTPETMGVPVKATMETVVAAHLPDGRAVRVDRNAMEADHIVVVNRIKPHTCFRGPYESGLLKMMAIGLGKREGAEICHSQGFGHMAENIRSFGLSVLTHAPVLLGVGIVENAADETSAIRALTPDEIPEEEPKLLKEARRRMARILLPSCDVLVVDRMGKNFSGSGMDPNITGRFATPYAHGGIAAQKLAVLDLSDASHGNCIGLGVADATTRRLVDKACLAYGYINGLTSLATAGTRLPMVLANDREAIGACIRGCVGTDRNNARIIRIADTLHLSRIMVSESLLDEVARHGDLEVCGRPEPMRFDTAGNLLPLPWEA